MGTSSESTRSMLVPSSTAAPVIFHFHQGGENFIQEVFAVEDDQKKVHVHMGSWSRMRAMISSGEEASRTFCAISGL